MKVILDRLQKQVRIIILSGKENLFHVLVSYLFYLIFNSYVTKNQNNFLIGLVQFRTRFLNLGTNGILGWIILFCREREGCLVHCSMFNSIYGLFPLDVSSAHPLNCDNQKYLQTLLDVPCAACLPPPENPWFEIENLVENLNSDAILC